MSAGRGREQWLEGLRLLEAAQWDAAREAYEAALAEEETPDARDGLGLALWFLSDRLTAVASRSISNQEVWLGRGRAAVALHRREAGVVRIGRPVVDAISDHTDRRSRSRRLNVSLLRGVSSADGKQTRVRRKPVNYYVNIHSRQFKDGALRGQIAWTRWFKPAR